MKTTVCDLCKGIIVNETVKEQIIQGYLDNNRPIIVEIKVDTFQFNCTDFDVCQTCLNKALKDATNTHL